VLCHHLSTNKDIPINICVPSDSCLESVSSEELQLLRQQCTYNLTSISHAIRHASSLFSILSQYIGSQQSTQAVISSTEYIPWLVDTFSTLYQIQMQWQSICPDVLSSTLESAVRLTAILQTSPTSDSFLKQKGSTLLVLVANEAIEHFDRWLLAVQDHDNAIELLCSALLALTALSLDSKPTANYITLQLIPRLETLAVRGELVLPYTDLRVSTNC
jgi:serine/threonine-protein kinase ATR